jgi:hypothetical protein
VLLVLLVLLLLLSRRRDKWLNHEHVSSGERVNWWHNRAASLTLSDVAVHHTQKRLL